MKSLKDSDKINELYIAFVVTSKNYENILDFIKFAEDNKIQALFWEAIGNQTKKERLDICNPSHPDFINLLNLLKTINLESEYAHFSKTFHYIKNRFL